MGADAGREVFPFGDTQQFGKFADAVERPVRGQPLFVQRLHRQIDVDEQPLIVFVGQFHPLRQSVNIIAVENAVVVHLFGAVVVDHPYAAQFFRTVQEAGDFVCVIHKQPHLEILVIGSVFLRTDIGNVEIEFADERQNVGHASGNVLQKKFQQDDAGFVGIVVPQIADFFKLRVRLTELFGGSFGINEQGVGIHGLVVADAGNVDPQRGKAPARFQKRTDMIGHGGNVGFFHGSLPAV